MNPAPVEADKELELALKTYRATGNTDVILAWRDKAVVAARRESSKRLVDEIATYGDGQTVYFNKEAVVPISRVLAELNGAKIE